MGKKDRAEYRKQYKESNEKGVYPVVSLVLNWGERPWNGAKSIRDLWEKISFIEKRLEDYIGNSKIHVFDMRFLNSEVRERFQGDVRIVLDYLSDGKPDKQETENESNSSILPEISV